MAAVKPRHPSKGSCSSKKKMELNEIEDMFIEKLQEKYQLTERDLKRAFSRFDLDKSGFLDVKELAGIPIRIVIFSTYYNTIIHQTFVNAGAIRLFLNGIDQNDVNELVKHYDIDGDGVISIAEFSQMLMSRNSVDKSEWITVDYLTSGKLNKGNNQDDNVSMFTSSRKNSSVNENTVEKRVERNANNNNEIKDDTNSTVISEEQFSSQSAEYQAKTFLRNLRALFFKQANELRQDNKLKQERLSMHFTKLAEVFGRRLLAKAFSPYYKSSKTSGFVNFTIFSKVLKQLSYQGTLAPRRDTLQLLFEMCCDPDADQSIENGRADPDRLVDIMFDKGKQIHTQFGFMQQADAPLEHKRPDVGRGPVRQPPPKETYGISDIPLRFVTRKCRTSLAAPTGFDMSQLQRSNEYPDYSHCREYVFGLSATPYSGSPIWNFTGPVVGGAEMLIYETAALAVMHDLSSGRQIFLEGHNDDICCITVSPSPYALVATGQIGKRPYVCVWEVTELPATTRNVQALRQLGLGFFERGVSALSFSYDARLLCAVSCDDHHSMGIWDILSGVMLADTTCQNGLPPQIRGISWGSSSIATPFVTKDHDELCDFFCTAGERHLRFWSFQRPPLSSSSPPAKGSGSLRFKAGRMGKITEQQAKVYNCVCVLSQSLDRAHSTVFTGGSNGMVYVWLDCVCVKVVKVMSELVQCMSLDDHTLFVGGSGGRVVSLDRSDLKEISSFSVLPADSVGGEGRVTTSRPGSAGRARTPATGASGGGGVALNRPSSAGAARRPTSAKNGNGAMVGDVTAGKPTAGAEGKRLRKIPVSGAPKNAWDGPKEVQADKTLPVGTKASTTVCGITLIRDRNGNTASMVVVTGFGKAFRITVNSASRQSSSSPAAAITPVLDFHYGSVYALATTPNFVVTGADDRWICVWSLQSYKLLVRARALAPIRCLDVCPRGMYLCSGTVGGCISIYVIELSQLKSAKYDGSIATPESKLIRLTALRETMRDITDMKFSPNMKMLAAGTREDLIEVYHCKFQDATHLKPASASLRHIRRLRGHSSAITHIDWSSDNRLLQSNCGAYEILYWDVKAGTQLLSAQDSLEADTAWNSHTCVLGFTVMGIWPSNTDGTDVNIADVHFKKRLVVTGDDFALVKVFNYPCVVKNAPCLVMSGHSSHVMNVRFIQNKDENNPSRSSSNTKLMIASVGSHDNSAMLWSLTRNAQKAVRKSYSIL